MDKLTNKEKAMLTYNELQRRKQQKIRQEKAKFYDVEGCVIESVMRCNRRK